MVAIATGYGHSLALKSDGTVVAWGNNAYGQTNVPEGLSGVVAVAASWHSLVITASPSVTINQAAGQADPAVTTPILFTASFSKPVSGFTAEDVTLNGTAHLTGASITVSGGPSVYTISVNGLAGNGTVIATIAANVATDAVDIGNLASTSTDNTVSVNLDSTAPIITPSVVGTLGNNGWYLSDVSVNWGVVDSESAISSQTGCDAQSVTSDTSGIPYTCTATSAGGTSTQSVTVKRDATPPTITAAATTSPNNGWYKSDVIVSFICSDAGSGIALGACPADENLSREGSAVSSTARTVIDQAGNTSAPSNVVTVQIDKTQPTLTWNGGLTADSSYYFGFVPAVPTCTAADALSGPNGCVVSNYSSDTGTHTMIATAQDKAGNSYSEQRSYTVSAWTLKGFYQPVDMSTSTTLVYNTVKNGSTVPIKFEIFAGPTELTDVAYVKPLTYAETNCNATFLTDDIETVTTGGTALRYDTTAGQYVYNWKTPNTANKCYRVAMTTNDGSKLEAYFKLK